MAVILARAIVLLGIKISAGSRRHPRAGEDPSLDITRLAYREMDSRLRGSDGIAGAWFLSIPLGPVEKFWFSKLFDRPEPGICAAHFAGALIAAGAVAWAGARVPPSSVAEKRTVQRAAAMVLRMLAGL
jgi:hypothetical protein